MNAADLSRNERDFTPALPLLGIYDMVVATVARESVWRPALLRQLDARAGDVVADIGCGTGTFLALVGKATPSARLIGMDPDPRILERAQRKLSAAGVAADLEHGYLRDAATGLAGKQVGKIVSSLVFHQVPLAEKRAGLAAIFAALKPGGELHIADYGLQRTRLMRWLFRWVQRVDGYEHTQPNADGILIQLLEEAGFSAVAETMVVPTPSGSISLYRATRPRG